MEVDQIISAVQQYAPMAVQYALMGLGSLVVGGYSYIKLTPNQEDDAWLKSLEDKAIIGHVLRLLVAFSPVQRKENLKDVGKIS